MQFNICDFGAVADGISDNTANIQQAIDACAAAGGGVVLVPPGTFATDMLTLRDHVEFHLASGSRLLSLLQPVPDPAACCAEPSCNPHRWLVGGVKVKNVAITGAGAIDGRAAIHFWNKNDGLDHPLYGQRYWPRLHRPKGMIHFRESSDVVIRDITLIDPPCYNLWLLGCDRCEISGVRIDADLRGPNDDGIDIDCSSNVRIHHCDIVCGDDGIALKSDIHELGYDKPCENIIISDCRIHTTSDGIRLGYEGDGAIRRVVVSNCVIHDTMIGISLMVAISPDDGRGVDIYKGPEITDVSFDNLIIHAFQAFNFQHPRTPADCPDPIRGFMDRIWFRNITAHATRGSFLGGAVESPIRHLEFSNLHLTLSGQMGNDFLDAVPNPYPMWSDLEFSGIPWPFYVRNARDVVLRDSTIVWENAEGCWQPEAVRAENAAVVVERVRRLNAPVAPRNVFTSAPEVIFPIGQIEGMPFFMPPVGFDPEAEMRKVIACNDANTDALSALPDDVPMPPERHINASFIYAHPPDYHGLPMLNASVAEWRRTFQRFRQMRIDTAIFQAALWRELNECFYGSTHFAAMKCYHVLERMFEAAAAENIRIYLGGYGSVAGWKERFSAAELNAELEFHRICFEELYKLGKISGMYFPSETAFDGRRAPARGCRMQTLYRAFSEMVKSRDSRLKVIVSPATMHRPAQNAEFTDFWNAILESCGIDILMPQDSIGNCNSRLTEIPQLWAAWKALADAHKLELWSHIEIFERRGFTPDNNLYPAAPERVAAQIALTAPFVSGFCCWEALYFTADAAGRDALRLRRFLSDGTFGNDRS